MADDRRFVAALDVGTTGVRCLLFDAHGTRVAGAYRELVVHNPEPGRVEQDPRELVQRSIDVIHEALRASTVRPRQLVALGLTNQRETVLAWDKASLEPLYPAIGWQDRRSAERCEQLRTQGHAEGIRGRTGLPCDPYFSAPKLQWLLEHVEGLSGAVRAGNAVLGTVDSWLLDSLCGVHLTDVTNASRTQLLDLRELRWAPDLGNLFGVPLDALPEIRPSLSSFGTTKRPVLGIEVPVAAVLGDQQASLLGHGCLEPGPAKSTWGTGAFLLTNTGTDPVISANGLVSTVAYSGSDLAPRYALEGSIFSAGACLQWLRDGLGLLERISESEELAFSIPSTEGVYFVPALVGLGAPYWDPSARGTILGMTHKTGRAHLVRAALEAIAFRTHDVLSALEHDTGHTPAELRVDGGAAVNRFLCQFQSDISGVPVVRARETETTALGAALAAGWAKGFWSAEEVAQLAGAGSERFAPCMPSGHAAHRLEKWTQAVERARGWEAGPS